MSPMCHRTRAVLAAAALWLASPTLVFAAPPQRIVVSANHRFLQTEDGKPFFWLADTGWLLFQNLTREEAEQYLENRRAKGFNVIQAMVLHEAGDRNAYGVPALDRGDPARPHVQAGELNYWDHIDWVIDRAASKGIYIALVPCWGSIVKKGTLNERNVEGYARFLAERYRRHVNIVWFNGGDLQGDVHPEVWRALGRTLKAVDPDHLVAFHPFGRTQSSTWFHNEPWLDFNMFQSGHQSYEQDPNGKGEDNWRYVQEDYQRDPVKPTLDAEPSYEDIPRGLHDLQAPRWQDRDCRRYAYWSVFAGALGHTYGHNAVMQMYKPGRKASFGNTTLWSDAIDAPGAGQMQYLAKLMLSKPYFERVPDPSLVAGENGQRYDYIAATRGQAYAFLYTYSGRAFEVVMGKIAGAKVRARWYDPRTGASQAIGTFANRGTRKFVPPVPGSDWVLVLEKN